NPLLVSLDVLEAEGLLMPADLADTPAFPEPQVDYGDVIDFKRSALARACARFRGAAGPPEREAFAAFCRDHAAWLDDFALFMAVKAAHGGVAPDGGGRRAPRLFQRHRPALGKPALPLGRDGAHRLRVVDRPLPLRALPRGHGAPRPFPRLRGLLGDPRLGAHRGHGAVGEG